LKAVFGAVFGAVLKAVLKAVFGAPYWDSHFKSISGASLSYSFLIISLISHFAYIGKSTISL
jgi:hypothetical protein